MNDYFSSSWSGVKGGRSMKVKQNDDGTNLGEIPNLGSPVQVFHERSRFDELKQFVYFWSKKPGSLLMTLICRRVSCACQSLHFLLCRQFMTEIGCTRAARSRPLRKFKKKMLQVGRSVFSCLPALGCIRPPPRQSGDFEK